MVGVKFRPMGRVRYFDPVDLELAVGDRVEVETPDGPREGEVAIAPDQVLFSDLRGPMGVVIRKVERRSAV